MQDAERLFGGVPSVAPAALTSAAPVPASSAAPASAGFTSVPLSSGAAAPAAAATTTSTHPMTGFGSGSNATADGNTLDEPVLQTLKRDALTIGRNLRSVLIPAGWDFDSGGAALQNWDLWGPLIFMLALAITLSVGEREPSDVFALVFTEVAVGSLVLTANVVLLGGSIVFFQSLCLMGYCLFPICLAAVVCVFVHIMWVRTIVLVAALAWASAAAVPFVGRSVRRERRALAVYPVLLMYVSIGWLALVKR